MEFEPFYGGAVDSPANDTVVGCLLTKIEVSCLLHSTTRLHIQSKIIKPQMRMAEEINNPVTRSACKPADDRSSEAQARVETRLRMRGRTHKS